MVDAGVVLRAVDLLEEPVVAARLVTFRYCQAHPRRRPDSPTRGRPVMSLDGDEHRGKEGAGRLVADAIGGVGAVGELAGRVGGLAVDERRRKVAVAVLSVRQLKPPLVSWIEGDTLPTSNMSVLPSPMPWPLSPSVNAYRWGSPEGHLSVTQRRLPVSLSQHLVQSQPRRLMKSEQVVPAKALHVVPRQGAWHAAGGGGERTGTGGGGLSMMGAKGPGTQQPEQSQSGRARVTAAHGVCAKRWQTPSPHARAHAPPACAGGGGEAGRASIGGRHLVASSSAAWKSASLKA